MKRNLQPLFFLTSLLLAVPAHAHDLIPASWCHGGSRQVILEEFFTQDRLQTYKNTHLYIDLTTGLPCPPTVKCGIVDDWHWATQMMNEGIPPIANQRSASTDVIAVPATPDYRNREDHHALYSFEDGLKVQYLGCVFTNTTTQTSGR
jgi:hypothetical protein